MAIDTAAKRFSCIGLGGMPWHLNPIPDGSLATGADRAHMAYLYAGITLSVPIVGDIVEIVLRGRHDVPVLRGRHDVPVLRGRADTSIALRGRV